MFSLKSPYDRAIVLSKGFRCFQTGVITPNLMKDTVMAQQFNVYKCELCGNVVELLHAVTDNLHCCGQPMKHMAAGSTDASTEKHVPVFEKPDKGCLVKVGSVPHPMEEKHYIEWVELCTAGGKRYKRFLKPGETPEALFCCPPECCASDRVTSVREYCNLHGLWKADV